MTLVVTDPTADLAGETVTVVDRTLGSAVEMMLTVAASDGRTEMLWPEDLAVSLD